MQRFLLKVGLLSMLAAPMFAGVLIDFSGGAGGSPGTITVGANVVGSGIAITNMLVLGVSSTLDGNYAISGGALNFSFTNPGGALNSFVITGTVGICSNAGVGTGGGTCAGGTTSATGATGALLTGIAGDTFSFTTLNGAIQVSGNGPDNKLPDLLARLGIAASNPNPWAFAGFTIGGVSLGNGVFLATSTDIGNNSVPEPASILMLGTVLVGVTQLIRRRTSNA